MKRVIKLLSLGLIFAFLIVNTGCSTAASSRSINFMGESEHWVASCSFLENQDQTLKYRISYKGSDAASVGPVKYSFAAKPYIGTNGEIPLPSRGYIESASASSKGNYPNKDLVIKVKIEWAGQSENLDLMYTKQQL